MEKSSMKRKRQFRPKQALTTQVQHGASPITWEALQEKSVIKGKENKSYEAAEGVNFYELKISIPNRSRDDFNILIKGRMLHIKLKSLFISGEPTSEFISILNRPIILPGNLDPDFISAEYQNGTLRLYFYKSMCPCDNQVEEIFVY